MTFPSHNKYYTDYPCGMMDNMTEHLLLTTPPFLVKENCYKRSGEINLGGGLGHDGGGNEGHSASELYFSAHEPPRDLWHCEKSAIPGEAQFPPNYARA